MKGFAPAALCALLLSAPPALAADAEQGRAKSAQCVACHGPDGVTPVPTYPHLAGQNAAYLELQMRKFRDGEREDPLMSPIAQALSDEDIDDLASFYSALARPVVTAQAPAEE